LEEIAAVRAIIDLKDSPQLTRTAGVRAVEIADIARDSKIDS
jgi:hypothetical protein